MWRDFWRGRENHGDRYLKMEGEKLQSHWPSVHLFTLKVKTIVMFKDHHFNHDPKSFFTCEYNRLGSLEMAFKHFYLSVFVINMKKKDTEMMESWCCDIQILFISWCKVCFLCVTLNTAKGSWEVNLRFRDSKKLQSHFGKFVVDLLITK